MGYTCTEMKLTLDSVVLDVVEGADIELERAGGVEGFYNSETGKHAIGMKRGRFTVRRHLRDNLDSDLIFDLFDNKLPFSLSGEIDGVANSQLVLSDCIIYRYRWVMGGVNDIVAEEAQGECLNWSSNI